MRFLKVTKEFVTIELDPNLPLTDWPKEARDAAYEALSRPSGRMNYLKIKKLHDEGKLREAREVLIQVVEREAAFAEAFEMELSKDFNLG